MRRVRGRRRGTQRQMPKSGPSTIIGRWLYAAAVLDDPGVRNQLGTRLNGGLDGWNPDEPAVIEAACELVLARAYPQPPTDSDLDLYVSTMFRVSPNLRERFSPDQVARIMKAASGRSNVSLDGIRRQMIMEMQGSLFARLTIGLRLPPDEIAHLVVSAEHLAIERGFQPPLDQQAG